MRQARWLLVLAVMTATAVMCALHQHAAAHILGIDTQASDNYAFFSGVGPMLLTAAGMSTLVSGMFRHVNCNEQGCWRIGRHKIGGTPWCNRHHENARAQHTLEDKLDTLITLLGDYLARTGPQ